MDAAAKVKNPLGRVTAIGPKEPWQAVLLLPSGWSDYRNVVRKVIDLPIDGHSVVMAGRMAHDASTGFHRGVPKLHGTIQGEDLLTVNFSLFGDHRETAERLRRGTEVAVAGIVASIGGKIYLNNAELVDTAWLGRLCPKYPGKPRVIGPDLVRQRVLSLLPEVEEEAAGHLLEGLRVYGNIDRVLEAAGAGGPDLGGIIRSAHLPETEEEGRAAQEVIEHLAAMNAVTAAWSNRAEAGGARAFTFDWERVAKRVKALPYPLTDEQRRGIYDSLKDMQRDVPMRRILSGDVGTGKTFVYAVAAAAVADHGGRVAVLAPTGPLATQIAGEFTENWPDLDVALVGGDDPAESYRHKILVGTTALLFRDVGQLDFVVVDEQQKFSRQQREQLTEQGSHLLEASGTCIPRSMALIRYGVVQVSRLTKTHTKKEIRSKLWEPGERARLMESVEATIQKGGQVLVVYPLKEGKGRTTAEAAFQMWESRFPGRTRLVHSKISDEDKANAIADLKDGKADLLVSTTVVEVGISIPRLRHVVVIEPDRLGLTQLHQIRGRVARNGGVGYFSMYPRRELKERTRERLQVLLDTTDGFEIAERDLALRGYGSLKADADRQTGHDELLFGRPVRLEVLDYAVEVLSKWD